MKLMKEGGYGRTMNTERLEYTNFTITCSKIWPEKNNPVEEQVTIVYERTLL